MGGRSGKIRPRTNKTLNAVSEPKRPAIPPDQLERQERFLTKLIEFDCHIGRACKAAGVGRSTVYQWKHGDEDYRKRYDRARQIVLEDLESTLMGRARDSDKLLTFALERRFPEAYGKRVKVDGQTTVTALDPEKLKAMTDEEIDGAIAFVEKLTAGAK